MPIVAVSGLMGEGIDRLMSAIEAGLCGMEQAGADRVAQSLVRAGGRRQPAAGGVGPAAEAELHHAGQGAAAEFCVVLLARGRRAAILSALSRQFACASFSNCRARRCGSRCAKRPIRSPTSASGRHERGGSESVGRNAAGAQRRGGLHLRHHPARHARARPDHADPAQAGGKLCR